MFYQWDQSLDTEQTNAIAKELSTALVSQIGDELLRERLSGLIASNDFSGLCNFPCVYTGTSVSDAIMMRQVLALYQKRADLDIGIDKREAALKTFKEAEDLCLETNHIFRQWSRGLFQFPTDVEEVLHLAQRKVDQCLGDVPKLEDLKLRFGPGATTQVPKRMASPRRKIGKTFACSEELAPYICEVLEQFPGWVLSKTNIDMHSSQEGHTDELIRMYELVPQGESYEETALIDVEIVYGVIVFVLKNAKTFRAVGPEPSINGMCQLGIGGHMQTCLRSVRIDITDQTRNQQLARRGSITGVLATLDLSSASDTIATEFVAHMVSFDWFDFLSRFRTGTVMVEGKLVRLQKFATMGNGFTFPLETVLFWSLASACTVIKCGVKALEDMSVFGDDIIVPVDAYDLLCRTLQCVGFIPNSGKSFASGPFRESCGADYLSGIDIRPVYLKDRMTGSTAFTLHNEFVRRGMDELACIVRSHMDPTLILWGPDGYGDGHLIKDDFSPAPFRRGVPGDRKIPGGWAGYTFETYAWKRREDFAIIPGDYVYPSYTSYERGESTDYLGDPEVNLFRRWPTRYNRIEKTWEHIYAPVSASERARAVGKLTEFTTGKALHKRGRLGTVVPGRGGYKRITIYTLKP